ncbi:hypothetical protein SAMN05880501_107191 [Ureibacillus xyleni]|uniref:Uncharacterized protein n=1 Tax=Ureibacillus xyleni TaxID=614648 RepID=A0A285SXR5_9BACL|nr:hypothetical protein [Ureibacillus xyleni]SOC13450.1 hypothetical protein SAMN05880501_107191 [Ureibacillus xyleni]
MVFGFIGKMIFDKKSQNRMMNQMSTIEESQTNMYQLFENEIKALQQGPFEAGMIYLEDAKKEHRSAKETNQLIEQAKKEFISSCGILKAKQEKAPIDLYSLGVTQSYIAMSWLMLNKPYDAKDYMADAVKTLSDAEISFRNEIQAISKIIPALQHSQGSFVNLLMDGQIKKAWERFSESDGYEQQRKKLPSYTQKLGKYRQSLNELTSYKNEMVELKLQIDNNIEENEKKKELSKNVAIGVKDIAVGAIQNDKVKELASIDNVKKIGGLFARKNK